MSAAIHADPELRELFFEAREEVLDKAEAGLASAVSVGSPWAIRFALTHLGKNRGYGQTIKVETDAGSRVVVYMPDDGREQRDSNRDGNGDSAATGSADGSPHIEG